MVVTEASEPPQPHRTLPETTRGSTMPTDSTETGQEAFSMTAGFYPGVGHGGRWTRVEPRIKRELS
ncbi:MAG: hypothetical protein ACE5Z5_01735 [Candidatus Bathyarchaeia archaeon]